MPPSTVGWQQQVFGGIAADRELGEDRELRPLASGALGSGDDSLDVAVEVSDGRVDLTQRDEHRRSGAELHRQPERDRLHDAGDLFYRGGAEASQPVYHGADTYLRRARA